MTVMGPRLCCISFCAMSMALISTMATFTSSTFCSMSVVQGYDSDPTPYGSGFNFGHNCEDSLLHHLKVASGCRIAMIASHHLKKTQLQNNCEKIGSSFYFRNRFTQFVKSVKLTLVAINVLLECKSLTPHIEWIWYYLVGLILFILICCLTCHLDLHCKGAISTPLCVFKNPSKIPCQPFQEQRLKQAPYIFWESSAYWSPVNSVVAMIPSSIVG